MKFVIEHVKGGSWFKQWTQIGPCFTGKREEAAEFDDKFDAARTMGGHYGFTMYEIVSGVGS